MIFYDMANELFTDLSSENIDLNFIDTILTEHSISIIKLLAILLEKG